MKTKSNVWENSRADPWEFSQTLPRFSPGYEGTENMFHIFYKIIIFRLNKKKDYIRRAYLYLNFFHETVTSHNLKTELSILLTSFSCFIALSKHTCRPIKPHVLSKLFYKIQCFWWNLTLAIITWFYQWIVYHRILLAN